MQVWSLISDPLRWYHETFRVNNITAPMTSISPMVKTLDCSDVPNRARGQAVMRDCSGGWDIETANRPAVANNYSERCYEIDLRSALRPTERRSWVARLSPLLCIHTLLPSKSRSYPSSIHHSSPPFPVSILRIPPQHLSTYSFSDPQDVAPDK